MTRLTKRSRAAQPQSEPVVALPVRRSWTALVAATTLGMAGASMVHADIQSNARLEEGRTYRLIVQSYNHADAATLDHGERPVASVQRAVTAAELKSGVRVDLLEFRQDRRHSDANDSDGPQKPVVVAWVEEGRADLELDGLRARPQPGSLRGLASRRSTDQSVQISVRAPYRAA